MRLLTTIPDHFREMGLVAPRSLEGKERDVLSLPNALHKDDVEVAGLALKEQPARLSKGVSRLAELVAMAREQGMEVKEEEDFASRVLTFTASTDDRDRYGDRILVDGVLGTKKWGKGWVLRNWHHNPVFMGFHQHKSMPLGTAIDTWTDQKGVRKRLRMSVLMDDGGVNPAAPPTTLAFKKRVLRTVSVGFLPEKLFEPESPEERDAWGLGPHGYLFAEQELLENSAVSIPANPHARLEGIGMDAAEAVGLLAFADGIEKVDAEQGRSLRDMVFKGAGFVMVDEALEGAPLTEEPASGDHPPNAPAAAGQDRVLDAVGALSTKVEALGRSVEALARRVPEPSSVGEGSERGERSTASDSYFTPVMQGFERMGKLFEPAARKP